MKQKNVSKIIVSALTLAAAVLIVSLGIPGERRSIEGAASGTKIAKNQKITIASVRRSGGVKPQSVQLGHAGIDGLIDALERYGAKIDLSESEEGLLTTLHVKVDGIRISPIITDCKQCEPIVFEY